MGYCVLAGNISRQRMVFCVGMLQEEQEKKTHTPAAYNVRIRLRSPPGSRRMHG